MKKVEKCSFSSKNAPLTALPSHIYTLYMVYLYYISLFWLEVGGSKIRSFSNSLTWGPPEGRRPLPGEVQVLPLLVTSFFSESS